LQFVKRREECSKAKMNANRSEDIADSVALLTSLILSAVSDTESAMNELASK